MESEPLLGGSRDDHENKERLGDDLQSEIFKSTKDMNESTFIDNMLFIVQRKDVYPRLFNVKLNSVLAKAIAGVIVSGTAAILKLLF